MKIYELIQVLPKTRMINVISNLDGTTIWSGYLSIEKGNADDIDEFWEVHADYNVAYCEPEGNSYTIYVEA